jgi:hypothetical protein
MTTRKRWSKSIGERGRRVRLYEARPGGPIMRAVWIDGKEVRRSLGLPPQGHGRRARDAMKREPGSM